MRHLCHKKTQMKNRQELHEFLEMKAAQYEQAFFLDTDPISIPHSYKLKEDQEISGFIAATLAWGQRVTIIRNAQSFLERMDNDPYSFVMNSSEDELVRFEGFVHRTFNAHDAMHFVLALRHVYKNHNGLESLIASGEDAQHGLAKLHEAFFEIPHETRTRKHVSNPLRGSSSKRLNMYLRWMVRGGEVDLGIWKNIPPAKLMLPLDVHTGNVSRKLGLLNRKQNDWKAVEEVTEALRKFDPKDPVKYDFALFGLGVFENF
mgnify:CR=1 FL=1